MVFARVKTTQIDDTKPVNALHISLAGQWSPDAQTYKRDYVHPGFFNALYSQVVRLPCPLLRLVPVQLCLELSQHMCMRRPSASMVA